MNLKVKLDVHHDVGCIRVWSSADGLMLVPVLFLALSVTVRCCLGVFLTCDTALELSRYNVLRDLATVVAAIHISVHLDGCGKSLTLDQRNFVGCRRHSSRVPLCTVLDPDL